MTWIGSQEGRFTSALQGSQEASAADVPHRFFHYLHGFLQCLPHPHLYPPLASGHTFLITPQAWLPEQGLWYFVFPLASFSLSTVIFYLLLIFDMPLGWVVSGQVYRALLLPIAYVLNVLFILNIFSGKFLLPGRNLPRATSSLSLLKWISLLFILTTVDNSIHHSFQLNPDELKCLIWSALDVWNRMCALDITVFVESCIYGSMSGCQKHSSHCSGVAGFFSPDGD